jgi:membrane protein YqaA with SNARE-associated domain
MSASSVSSETARSRSIFNAGLGALVVVVIAIGATVLLADTERRSQIELLVQSPVGIIGLFVFSALSSATLLLPVPGMALTVLAAGVAEPVLVGIVAGFGQAVGELTGYLAGSSGRSVVGERVVQSRIAHWMRARGTLTVFVLAIVPNPVFDVAGVLAGVLGLPMGRYLAAAASGKIIRNVALAWTVASGGAALLATPA